jgi:hypothetical protein
MQTLSRRAAMRSLFGGTMLLPGVLSQLAAAEERDPLAPRPPHFGSRAKRVIFLFSQGGVAHMETFDPKPKLFKADGKMTGIGGGLSNQQKKLLRPSWEFRPGGKCGTPVSDLFPCLREQMDDIALIKSMKSDDNEHFQATLAIHTGSFFAARPSLGSWVSYGLGTMNQNLPSFIAISPYSPYAGAQIFSNDFLPAYHQGTRVIPSAEPIPNLKRRSTEPRVQEAELGLAQAFERDFLKRSDGDGNLAARIRTFETAYAMQTEATEAFDLSRESDETLALYGL